jgi:hypothetical protein
MLQVMFCIYRDQVGAIHCNYVGQLERLQVALYLNKSYRYHTVMVYYRSMYKFISLFVFIGAFFVMASSVSAAGTTTASSSVSLHNPTAVESLVRTVFIDAPVMIEVARCESTFRQYTDAGSVFRGGADGGMVGVFQFYEAIHAASAAVLGFDIATLEGNVAYARHVYDQSGTTPWSSCVPATLPDQTGVAELRITLLKQVVVLLQQLLVLKMAGA